MFSENESRVPAGIQPRAGRPQLSAGQGVAPTVLAEGPAAQLGGGLLPSLWPEGFLLYSEQDYQGPLPPCLPLGTSLGILR